MELVDVAQVLRVANAEAERRRRGQIDLRVGKSRGILAGRRSNAEMPIWLVPGYVFFVQCTAGAMLKVRVPNHFVCLMPNVGSVADFKLTNT